MTALEWKQGNGKDLKAGDIYLINESNGDIVKLPVTFSYSSGDINKKDAIAFAQPYIEEMKEGPVMYFINNYPRTGPMPSFRLSYHSESDWIDNTGSPFYFDIAEYEERVRFMYSFNGKFKEYLNEESIPNTFMTNSKYSV